MEDGYHNFWGYGYDIAFLFFVLVNIVGVIFIVSELIKVDNFQNFLKKYSNKKIKEKDSNKI